MDVSLYCSDLVAGKVDKGLLDIPTLFLSFIVILRPYPSGFGVSHCGSLNFRSADRMSSFAQPDGSVYRTPCSLFIIKLRVYY
jgi:hypothetical protein